MNEEQLDALMEWVGTLIDFKIECAFRRDASYEEMWEAELRKRLLETFKEVL